MSHDCPETDAEHVIPSLAVKDKLISVCVYEPGTERSRFFMVCNPLLGLLLVPLELV